MKWEHPTVHHADSDEAWSVGLHSGPEGCDARVLRQRAAPIEYQRSLLPDGGVLVSGVLFVSLQPTHCVSNF
jgi:hypothetical protein